MKLRIDDPDDRTRFEASAPRHYQPHRRPLFCSRSQPSNGRKYSIIGSAEISRVPVKV
jgi:hypothetical protein